ncbi:hypothetical protein HID58_030669 [Brassica napus]|uniref:Uncharacterized protein n=1 Tax=Brassica napus TaxID=3708 RepID=A0ABQ8CI67_BRANA|nr:hypothetical protein HID58_030669 [Brassica napus]
MSGDDSESERPFWEIVVPDLEYDSCSAIEHQQKAMTIIFSGVAPPPTLRVRSVQMTCQLTSNHRCLDVSLRESQSCVLHNLLIPITKGKLGMGTWQGIWLCEHRDAPTARKVVVTLNGI